MDFSVELRRRTLLASALCAAAGTALSCGANKAAWRYFTDDEARTVEAVTAQLIPADSDPGAREAGVVYYIDLQLSRRFKKHRATYRDGLAALDAACRKAHGKPFADLPSAEQVDALNSAQEHLKAFFNLILTHTRQGFYGDPRHGGNRNRVSWKMLHLTTPPVRGRQHYEAPRAG